MRSTRKPTGRVLLVHIAEAEPYPRTRARCLDKVYASSAVASVDQAHAAVRPAIEFAHRENVSVIGGLGVRPVEINPRLRLCQAGRQLPVISSPNPDADARQHKALT